MSKESSQSWEQIHFHIGDLNSGQSKKCIRTVLSKKRQNGRRTCAAHLSQMIVVAQSGQRIMILYPQEALDRLGQFHGQLV